MPAMYICLCHGFTDGQVKELAQAGVRSAAKVYQHFGVKPRCGKCVAYVRDMVKDGGEPIVTQGGCGAGCTCRG